VQVVAGLASGDRRRGPIVAKDAGTYDTDGDSPCTASTLKLSDASSVAIAATATGRRTDPPPRLPPTRGTGSI